MPRMSRTVPNRQQSRAANPVALRPRVRVRVHHQMARSAASDPAREELSDLPHADFRHRVRVGVERAHCVGEADAGDGGHPAGDGDT